MGDVIPLKVNFDLINVDDEPFELELLRDPYSLKSWLRYIKTHEGSTLEKRVLLFERACSELPGSYKIWKSYLELRVAHVEHLNPYFHAEAFASVNDCFERSLILLHKMPVIWKLYLQFLMKQPNVTKIRCTFNSALRALPVTQHDDIWDMFTKYAEDIGGLFCIHVYRRYIQVEPRAIENYIEILCKLGLWNEAARQYEDILNRPVFLSAKRKSNYQIWLEFSELVVQHPDHTQNIDVEKVFRAGIKRFSDQAGKLWTYLAQYYIRIGDYEKARSTFYEGMTNIMTVRNFTIIFDAFVEFEEQWLSARVEASSGNANDELSIDFHMAWLEKILDKRPLYINDVLLRQNINNVDEWLRRVKFLEDDSEKVVQVYTDAIKNVNPKLAHGSLGKLFSEFARFYENFDDLEQSRIIFEKATHVPFKTVNELAQVWIDWAEMELRHQNFDAARKLIGDAVHAPRKSHISFFDESLSPQVRLHKSSKIWMYYLDLEESVGTIETTRKLYDRVFELKIATPQVVVNYANLLEENAYFEDSFKIYERGVALFSYPVAFELWNLYLTKFVKRYQGTHMERTRDLFEQALEGCPPEFSKSIYLLYADFEEKFGKAKRSISILEKAADKVKTADRLAIYNVLLVKVALNYGVLATRTVYEKAIESLSDSEVKDMCLRFAEMETKLGEIDRARLIYIHGSQYCDPRVETDYWKAWQEFEIRYGNPEETVKEMLRIKRSVQTKFSTDSLHIAKRAAKIESAAAPMDPMEQLEMEKSEGPKALAGFVLSKSNPQETSKITGEEN
ncbi:Pre-mRNA-splicing factor cwf3 [Schizosaccharomyces pombe]